MIYKPNNLNIVKAQPGTILPTIPSILLKGYNKLDEFLTPIKKWEDKYNVKANASLGPLQFVNPEAWVGIDVNTLTTANYGNGGIKALREIKEVPTISKPLSTRTPQQKHESFLKGLDTWSERVYGVKWSKMRKDVQPRIEQEFRSKWKK